MIGQMKLKQVCLDIKDLLKKVDLLGNDLKTFVRMLTLVAASAPVALKHHC